jgi:ATPase family associated with various cellular activities (AAA)
MTDGQNWQDGNARYLSTVLAWLRLRLERQVEKLQAAALEIPAPVEVLPLDPQATNLTHRVTKEKLAQAGDEVAQKANEMNAAELQMQSPPALVALSKRLGLSDFERDTLLLCIAMELDMRIAAFCAHAQDDLNKPYPTFALAMELFDTPSWNVLSPEGPLRHWRLIEINQPGSQPLTTSPLRADERIVHYVKGMDYLDDRLAMFIAPLETASEQIDLPASQQSLVQQIKEYWFKALLQVAKGTMVPLLPVIQLVGPDVPGKQLVASRVASELRRHLYRLPVEMFPSQAANLEMLARLWERESMLKPLALYLDAQEIDSSSPVEGQTLPLNRFLAHCGHALLLLGARETWPRLGRTGLVMDVVKPTPAEQFTVWKTALGDTAPDSPALLASQFNLNLPAIQRIVQSVLDPAVDDKSTLPRRLWEACQRAVRPRLDTLAQRLDARVTWDDLVLPIEETSMLHQLADQVGQRSKVYEDWGFASKINRGLGINALFVGESGTGKTMAAEVIANTLHLNLYRIDLSAVVSKYIGETEKNLRRLFDAAEDGGAILFFDEADALFGKRSEVRDSHDRYANIEINYLLQRMEAYRGLAILATNMKGALDIAFMRRLRFVITFPFPGSAERKSMWQKVFPSNTPTEELDYGRLARFNLTGGSIHTIALNAAFLAAQANTPVTMQFVLDATRAEFRKLERPINEAEFRWQASLAASSIASQRARR